ncbi:MAG TPA: hypothetical protein VGP89_09375 [Candidatus Angelobacter sp.]|jgi:hypothetical protein|nr:hypothetical protein [Candidatus Angelobacter sp.]
MVNRKPKTGEKRRTRQPLKMDKLPMELLDRVMKERAAGRTWLEIEELSPRFEEWGKVEQTNKDAWLLAFKAFPGGRIPHTTLSRWYDIRVDQVKKEVLASQVRAREIAALFAGKGIKDLPEAVRTAISDQLFGMMQNADEKSRHKTVAGLLALGVLLNDQRKTELKGQQVEAETKRVQLLEREFEMRRKKFDEETDKAARKAQRGKAITTDDINRIRERTFGLPPIAGSAAA